ncbi:MULTISPECIES: OmpA family protein, partial [unclassified Myroides]|uniref:OmpA family protein n=1 Tax=unclassified Myroides TaxID=2642485 RepID=UPI003D2F9A2F
KLTSEYYYRYAQTLKAVENYDKSKALMDQFATMEQEDSRVKRYNQNRNYIQQIERIPSAYAVDLLDINSDYSDYGATVVGDQLVFTSARDVVQDIHTWTNEPFTQLYRATIQEQGKLETPVLVDFADQAKVNEATAVFTKDGNTMYFTRNNAKKNGKSKQNRDKSSLLKLYKAVKQSDGKWGLVEELPFNSDNFNTSHPALTTDGKWLYFASDREGTLGQSDLFRVALDQNGGYGEVENLGNTINTEGRESFPFISSDNQLFFASDGHLGLGGLDVFVSTIKADGSFGPVENLGKPVNSSLDDFGFYYDAGLGYGFVSSNRSEGKGSDNIYALIKHCLHEIKGMVYDQRTNEKLSKATVTIVNLADKKEYQFTTDADGAYRITDIECGTRYAVKASKEAYSEVEVVLQAKKETGSYTVDLGLEKAMVVHDDLVKKLQLKPIYFDFDRSNIRKDAAIELMKVVEVMEAHPTIKLDVRSHTDSRGNDAYNMSLSDRRVKSTIAWLIKQGIDPSRLTGRGYGESELLNKCSNGVPCTAAEHQLNRRSEFIILEI